VTTWLPDPSHYPEQMTPLSASVWFEALGRGLHEAMRELRGPFGGFRTRTDHGWAYESQLEPEWEHDPDFFRAAALGIDERWRRELQPRVWQLTGALHELRPELPPPAETVRMLDRLWDVVQEQSRIHFLVVIPAQVAAEIFRDRYVELYGEDDSLAPYRLLERPRPERELVALARRARELKLDHLIRDFPVEAALERLNELTFGRTWRRELGHYLDPLGGRGGRARWHELSLPREAELPRLTLEAVRLYLDHEPPEPPAAELVPDELLELHATCAPAFSLKEEHTYAIDYPGLLATREALLGFGRRLVSEALINEVDDVWLLTRVELRDALTNSGQAVRALVAERAEELAQGLRDGPRPYLGDPPPKAERHAALEKFYGSGGHGLSGAAASPGIGEGTARVIAAPDDFTRIRPGDILVTTTTTPAWTPLFPSLAALVTDTGGILSHAAVVAREFHVPAVVGAVGATTTIPDGARVRVNGTTGEITLL
jgi:rifampicin phosphotransferase